MPKSKIGLIGCGAAANRYYLTALKKQASEIQLYCVDQQEENAKKLRNKIGYGEILTKYQEILNSVDGVIVALPHTLHFPVSMDFLDSGVHVLCEKPLAEEKKQALEMIETAERNAVSLCVNNTRRLFPSLKSIHKTIKHGEIGKINSIKYWEGNAFAWEATTGFYVDPENTSKGILLDLGAHVLDTICWWLGGKPDVCSFKDDSFGGPESVAKIKAELDGCHIEIFLNRLCDLNSHFIVSGSQGTILGHPFEWSEYKIKNDFKVKEKKLKTKEKSTPEFVEKVFENFLKVVKKEDKPLINGRDVYDSICLIENCYKTRRRFHLPWYENIRKIRRFPGKILVTGASGFIGGRIVESLHLSGSNSVRAGIRRWSSAARIGRFPIEIVQLDIMNKSAIDAALQNVKHVVHCAYGSDGATVEGTRNLLEKCLENNIERFVQLSTTEIYGDVSGDVDEDFPLRYTGNQYNRAKIDAEKACWEYYRKGLAVTILRPHIVYGPFNRNWTLHFAELFLSGKWGIYENYGEGICNLIFIDDLVESVLLALKNENSIGQAFNVSGPEAVSWNEYFKKYNNVIGLPPLKTIRTTQAAARSALFGPLRMMGGFLRDNFLGTLKRLAEVSEGLEKTMKFTEILLRNTPSLEELKLFNKKAVYSNDKAQNLLEYVPSVTLDNGLDITVNWLRHQGLIIK